MKIREDIKDFLLTIPNDVSLVASTKYIDDSEMRKLYDLGINNFGENRVESFLSKYNLLSDLPITWHFIGHLQRNKAIDVINNIDYLHSLDSLKLADLIEKERNAPLNVFVEVSINLEENKNGVPVSQLDEFIESLLRYSKINFVGLMMMAIKGSDEESLNKQFEQLEIVKKHLENKYQISIPYLSMGMSGDYLIALKHHATHIRLGRILYKD